MDDSLRDLLARRKNRTLAIMLTEKEFIVDPHVPPDAARKMRKVILDQVNDYHDFCVDVLEAKDGGMQINLLALEKLEEIIGILDPDDDI